MRSLLNRAIHYLYAWACQRLYHELAWAYDGISWLVSISRWHTWRCAALPHVVGQNILELGFGTGRLLMELTAERIPDGSGAIVGVDYSAEMNHVARLNFARLGRKAPIVLARGEQLPFPDACFDTIIATFPAPYILERTTLLECRRLLDGNVPEINHPRSRIIIVGAWVSLTHSLLNKLLPIFFGAPDEGTVAAIADRIRACGLEPTFYVFNDTWADVSVIVAEPVHEEKKEFDRI